MNVAGWMAATLLLICQRTVLGDGQSHEPAWPPEQVAVDARVPQRVTIRPVDVGPVATISWHPTWPHIVSMRRTGRDGFDRADGAVTLGFNKAATQITLALARASDASLAVIETAEGTSQFADGTWAFVASDATVHGERAALESNPGNFRIGFWTDPEDFVSWDYDATRWGVYEVAVTYSLGDGEGSEITVATGDAKVSGTIKPTASWWQYETACLGTLSLRDAGRKTLTVRGTKAGAAVMNLKAVTLTPAPEGGPWPLVPVEDGSILLHSKDALIDGVTLRYEPKPEKNTLGFWSNPRDRARWAFVSREGEFDVEVLQGCGKGNGGSEVEILVDGTAAIAFSVMDTGGWQAFTPRIVGRIRLSGGRHTLTLAPIRKAGAAVMDVRQVRLVPIEN